MKACDCTGTVPIVKNGVEYCPLFYTKHTALYIFRKGHCLRLASDSGRVVEVHNCEAGKCGSYKES